MDERLRFVYLPHSLSSSNRATLFGKIRLHNFGTRSRPKLHVWSTYIHHPRAHLAELRDRLVCTGFGASKTPGAADHIQDFWGNCPYEEYQSMELAQKTEPHNVKRWTLRVQTHFLLKDAWTSCLTYFAQCCNTITIVAG